MVMKSTNGQGDNMEQYAIYFIVVACGAYCLHILWDNMNYKDDMHLTLKNVPQHSSITFENWDRPSRQELENRIESLENFIKEQGDWNLYRLLNEVGEEN